MCSNSEYDGRMLFDTIVLDYRSVAIIVGAAAAATPEDYADVYTLIYHNS